MAQTAARRAPAHPPRVPLSFAEWKPLVLKNAAASAAVSRILRTQLSGTVLGTQARLDTVLGYAYYHGSGGSLPWLAAAISDGRQLHARIAAAAAEMKEIAQLARRLEDWQQWFLQVPEQVAETASSVARDWTLIAEFGAKRLAESALDRELLLALLLHYVKTVTGKPHYNEVAVLLRESASLFASDDRPDARALRALYASYCSRFPLVLDACLALW